MPICLPLRASEPRRQVEPTSSIFHNVYPAGYISDDLMLYVYSVADFDAVDRLALVAEVFDQFPELRPLKCGPRDPPRHKVTTMKEALANVARPMTCFVVRADWPRGEWGALEIGRGRGRYLAKRSGKEAPEFSLLPHQVHLSYDRDWLEAGGGRLAMVAEFFSRLCEAIDAFYGFAGSRWAWVERPRSRPGAGLFPRLTMELPDVMWLNYFGPSWLKRSPRILGLGYGEEHTPNGGVVLRATTSPFVFGRDVLPMGDYDWKRPLMDALGWDTFMWPGQTKGSEGEFVPTWEEHFAASPGTDALPWANWEGDVEEQQRAALEKTFPKKARAAERLANERGSLPSALGRAEFSTGLSLGDLRTFFSSLAASTGGDLAGALGKALLAEVRAAPLGTERKYSLAVAPGGRPELVEFGYFIDDVDQADVYLFGSDRFRAACEDAFEAL